MHTLQTLQTETPASLLPQQRGQFEVAVENTLVRASLEARIRTGFGQHFNACIEGFMPDLATYRHVSGAVGIIGMRNAAKEPLFLEAYLDMPVEAHLAGLTKSRVGRHTIVEVGQFVVDSRAVVSDFFRDLVPFLREQGFDWVCFTGTNRIRSLLSRVGFEGLPLTVATQDRVGDSGASWGSYYQFEPHVIIGNLSDPHGDWIAATE